MQSIVDKHLEIVEQLCSGDEGKSLAAMKHHLNEVLQRVEVLIKDFPDYIAELIIINAKTLKKKY